MTYTKSDQNTSDIVCHSLKVVGGNIDSEEFMEVRTKIAQTKATAETVTGEINKVRTSADAAQSTADAAAAIANAAQSAADAAAAIANAAQSAADAAAAIANAASKSWTQSSAPTIGSRPNAINGDTWYDSDDGSKYEAIGGVWALQTTDVPLDPVAYYSMDEVPDIPDDPAGTIWCRTVFSASDLRVGFDWPDATHYAWIDQIAVDNNGLTVVNGIMQFTKTISSGGLLRIVQDSRSKTRRIKVKPSADCTLDINNDGTSFTKTAIGGQWNIIDVYLDGTGTTFTDVEGWPVGINYFAFDYIGTGAYLPGSVLDNSGHGNHGQAFAVTPVAGISGNGLQFIKQSYATFKTGTGVFGSSDYAVSAWIKRTGALSLYLISNRSGGYSNGYGIIGDNDLIKAYFISHTPDIELYSSGYSLSLNVWHHVMIRRSHARNALELCVDGAQRAAIDLTGYTNAQDADYFNLNTYGGLAGDSYHGENFDLDELSFYNYCPDDSKLLGLYRSKSLPKVYTRAQYLADSAASDGIITPAEKYNILVLWKQIGETTSSGSYGVARARAIALGVSYAALDAAWNALYAYLWTTPGVLIATSWDSNITASKTTLANLNAAYYAAELAQTNANTTADAQAKANAVPRYLGRFVGAHPSGTNYGDYWLVIDTDDSPIQRGCYYSNAGTPTRISLVSGETGYTTDALLLAKMQATMNDVAWAVKNSYGVASNYGISVYFESLAVVTEFVQKLFAQYLKIGTGGSLRGGDRYDETGAVIDGTVPGFFISASGACKVAGIEFEGSQGGGVQWCNAEPFGTKNSSLAFTTSGIAMLDSHNGFAFVSDEGKLRYGAITGGNINFYGTPLTLSSGIFNPRIARLSDTLIVLIDNNSRTMTAYTLNTSTFRWSATGSATTISGTGCAEPRGINNSDFLVVDSGGTAQMYNFDGSHFSTISDSIALAFSGSYPCVTLLSSTDFVVAGSTNIYRIHWDGTDLTQVGSTFIESGTNTVQSIAALNGTDVAVALYPNGGMHIIRWGTTTFSIVDSSRNDYTFADNVSLSSISGCDVISANEGTLQVYRFGFSLSSPYYP